jgi:ABC-2 type transport system permease protein
MSVVSAVFKRNLAGFFGNPAGYVFIILFVLLTAWFAFVTEEFFVYNQANLNPLTQSMPLLLMIFVASVTMSTWAEEKKLGTDELLFTLPSGDFQVVLGKFLASLAVFTAALIFTLSHVVILCHLGDPDLGLLVATYFGYWLMGAAFIATGMFASSLTNNITVGFILGALFCAVFAFAHELVRIVPGRIGDGIDGFAATSHLESFARGVIALKDVFYFVTIVVVLLFLNSVVLGKRRWPGGRVAVGADPRLHTAARIAAVIVIALSANVLIARFGGRVDITEERLSSLSEETKQILAELSDERPVFIQAWISEEVPPAYVETRDNLLGLLKEYDERGGDAVKLKICRPERFSQDARDAKEKFGIAPQQVSKQEAADTVVDEIFAGAAFICGVEEEVIPFFTPGLPIEYELTRTIRVVSKAERPKVGVIENEIKLFGSIDYRTRQRSPDWEIVKELRKQYAVDTVRADMPVPDDLDVVVAAMPSLLNDEKLDNLLGAIRGGKPALLFVDPLPFCDPASSPKLPKQNPQQNPYMAGRQPPGEPKCDISKLTELLGVRWSKTQIVWDKANPHPYLRHLPPEFVFVTDTGEGEEAAGGQAGGFNQGSPITSGLQEVVALFPGSLAKGSADGNRLTFEPLITARPDMSGSFDWDTVMRCWAGPFTQQFFQGLNQLPGLPTPKNYVLAARIRGEIVLPAPEEDNPEEDKPSTPPETSTIDVILVADLDLISNEIFGMRGSFDNVTFVLNCVDALSGDDSYVELRKRRRILRTLTTIEELEAEHREKKAREEDEAARLAVSKLAEAQSALDAKVRLIEEDTNLDMRSREIKIANVRNVEQRKFNVKKEEVEEEKERTIDDSHFEMQRQIDKIHKQKKVMAMILPVILPLLIALLVYFTRRTRENQGAAKSRLLRD